MKGREGGERMELQGKSHEKEEREGESGTGKGPKVP